MCTHTLPAVLSCTNCNLQPLPVQLCSWMLWYSYGSRHDQHVTVREGQNSTSMPSTGPRNQGCCTVPASNCCLLGLECLFLVL